MECVVDPQAAQPILIGVQPPLPRTPNATALTCSTLLVLGHNAGTRIQCSRQQTCTHMVCVMLSCAGASCCSLCAHQCLLLLLPSCNHVHPHPTVGTSMPASASLLRAPGLQQHCQPSLLTSTCSCLLPHSRGRITGRSCCKRLHIYYVHTAYGSSTTSGVTKRPG